TFSRASLGYDRGERPASRPRMGAGSSVVPSSGLGDLGGDDTGRFGRSLLPGGARRGRRDPPGEGPRLFHIDGYQFGACDWISRRTLLEAAAAGRVGVGL